MSDHTFSADGADLGQYLAEYLRGELEPALAQQVSAWLDGSAAARSELETMRALLTLDRSQDGPAPPALQAAFYRELGRIEAELTGKPNALQSLKRWLSARQPWAVAAAIAVLSFGLGSWLGPRSPGSSVGPDLAGLQSEVQALRLAVMQAQLALPAPESRLQAVHYGGTHLAGSDALLNTLSQVIASDQSPHVRLSAAQILLNYLDQPRVEQRYVELCLQQDDPTVQLVMLGMLDEVDRERAKQIGQTLLNQGHLSPQNKQLVQKFI